MRATHWSPGGPFFGPFGFFKVLLQSPGGLLWDEGSNTAVEDGLLKDVYDKFISEGVLNKFDLKDTFKPKDVNWNGGRGKKWDAHVGRNNSPMATGEETAFAVADSQKYKQGWITQRKIMARWRVSEEQLIDSEDSEGAYRSSRTENMTRLVDDISYREEFYMATDGRAIFARIDEADPDGDNTLELDSPGNIAGDDFGNRYMTKGMYICAVDPATGDMRAGVTRITDVNPDGSDVTANMTGLTEWANNDFVVQAAHGNITEVLDSAYEHAPWGLTALIDDGTYRRDYFGVDRTLYPNYASYVVANTGPLSFDLMQRSSDVLAQKLGGKIDAVWCHHSIRRLFLLLTQADRRYSDAASRMAPDGGTKAFTQKDITIGAVDITAIRTLGLGQMFLVDSTGIGARREVSERGKWVDRGGILRPVGSGADARHAYEAWWWCRYQLFLENCGKAARLDGITGQTLVVVRGE